MIPRIICSGPSLSFSPEQAEGEAIISRQRWHLLAFPFDKDNLRRIVKVVKLIILI
jgi:hypothetical protein